MWVAEPIPCGDGTFQASKHRGSCEICPESFYCSLAFAIKKKESGWSETSHGVAIPRKCPALIDCQPGSHSATCDTDPYEEGSIGGLTLSCYTSCGYEDSCIASCNEPFHHEQEVVFTVSCSSCGSDIVNITWSFRKCFVAVVSKCHTCYRWVNYIDGHTSPTTSYSKKWSRFNVTDWIFFSVFVKVELSNGQTGMRKHLWWYFDPYTGPFNCTISPDNGQPMDTLFTISCAPAPEQSISTLVYHLFVYNVEVRWEQNAITGVQLPEANPEDNFDLPLHLVARRNTYFYFETNLTVKIYPPVDGGFSEWSAWSICSESCGPGTWTRSRDCTNPAPAYGGADCVGSTTETQGCNVGSCPPEAGGYTEWTNWSTCTLTCGTGSQNRLRYCTNPAPKYGGTCVGESTQTTDCNTNPCPIDGGWTVWSLWGACTQTCGTGNRVRDRYCTNPTPQHGGASCAGAESETENCNTQHCPIDGGYTEWGDWSTCTLTCGTGSQNGFRYCTNPAPQYGGASCVGETTQTTDCNTNLCPIDGGWTLWSLWGACTQTCGTGNRVRDHYCTNPTPQHGGASCAGAGSETENCNTQPCPIDGGYTEWEDWSTCTLTCGSGSQNRFRYCTNPAPQYGGASCVGETTQTTDCNTNLCPIDGGWTLWSLWGACTQTCGTGNRVRDHYCTNPTPQHGGASCAGVGSETENCNTQPCPIDGGYTEWEDWSTCTLTCGSGSQNRFRYCTNPAPQYGGASCVGETTQTTDCNTNLCPIDGGWTLWSLWGACTQTCGTGNRVRDHYCTNPTPQHGGASCAGAGSETENCNTQSCPIDGGYTEWGDWSTCTQSCDTGSQGRFRYCTNPAPQHGGGSCIGSSAETQSCNTHVCPVYCPDLSPPINGNVYHSSPAIADSVASYTCNEGYNLAGTAIFLDCQAEGTWLGIPPTCELIVDGGFSEWSAWSICSASCGPGTWTRSRDCTNPAPAYGGADCVGSTTETQGCNVGTCPPEAGGYTEWTNWSTCTLTCGTGSQNRLRYCTNPAPKYGGTCVGESTQTTDCNTNPCPIDGGWTVWSLWGACTHTCGTGNRVRDRYCTNPTPQHGGALCVGAGSETENCNTQHCPIDGGYTEWEDWSTCTLTCGSGSQNRLRYCTNPAPQYGGTCVGESTQTTDCNTNPCPIDGAWTMWSLWGACTHTCGTGNRVRDRYCTDPTPQHGGALCVGAGSETENCNTQHCPIDGGYTEWEDWSTCTLTCGSGSQNRLRYCTSPAPQYGGTCVGESTQITDCNTNPCPIDGAWTMWSLWGACTHTCGTGNRVRDRYCTDPTPQHGGALCEGAGSETENCNTQHCPIDGGYTEWEDWSTCTLTCGSGSQNRFRYCTNPAPQYGGTCVGETVQAVYCNTNPCPLDGGWTVWSIRSACTHTCGTGNRVRDRYCTNPTPQHGGALCVGAGSETENCNTQYCPIDGGYTEWEDWSTCTLTCGTGSQNRFRYCTNPTPEYGGADCDGEPTGTRYCNTNLCPIDGGWTAWTEWIPCTQTCGTGYKVRYHYCMDPLPQYGGAMCDGEIAEMQNCSTDPCPIDGRFTEWTNWDPCPVSCGTGSHSRSRNCTNPAPQHGGQDCTGDTGQTKDCNTMLCPAEMVDSMDGMLDILDELNDEGRTSVRSGVVKTMATVVMDSFEIVQQLSVMANKVTEEPQELTEEAKDIMPDVYSSLADNLVHYTTEGEIPTIVVTNYSGMIVQGSGAMIQLFAETMEPAFGPNTKAAKDEKAAQTGRLVRAVDRVCDALLDRQAQDAQATIIKSEQVQVAVKKVSPDKLPGTKVNLQSQEGTNSITIPDDFTLPVEASNVGLNIVVFEKNPFVWSSKPENVQTPVISITLKDSDQNIIDVSGLKHPVKLLLPYDFDSTKANYLRLKVFVDKNKDNLSLSSDMYYSSKATFSFPTSDKIYGLKFTLPTNLTSLRVYISRNKIPELQDILDKGNLYPQELALFLEKFGEYLASVTNSSVIYFAGETLDETQGAGSETYVGVSLDLSNDDTVRVAQHLDPECLGNETVTTCEGRLEVEVEFRTFTLQCMYWWEANQSWSNTGCWLSTETNDNTVGCECDHLSAFGGRILVIPNVIDPVHDIELFLTFFDNPVVVTTVVIIWLIYTFLAIWARKADRRDKLKETVIRCGGSPRLGTHEYLVCILTGWWKQAGTTAHVCMNIKGTLGKSKTVCLTAGRQCLQTGYEDWFLLTTEYSLGDIHTVTLWHDNSGSSPHWFLAQVFVKDSQRGESWMFLCNNWLAVDRGNLGTTSVQLENITEEELRKQRKHHFFMKSTEDLRDGHIWLSIFSKPVRSSFTRLQRLTVCLSILLTTMLTDLMYLGIPTDDPADQVDAGSYQFSLADLAIGIQCSILMVPVNFVIMELFLRTKPRPPPNHTHSTSTIHKSKSKSQTDISEISNAFESSSGFPEVKAHDTKWEFSSREIFNQSQTSSDSSDSDNWSLESEEKLLENTWSLGRDGVDKDGYSVHTLVGDKNSNSVHTLVGDKNSNSVHTLVGDKNSNSVHTLIGEKDRSSVDTYMGEKEDNSVHTYMGEKGDNYVHTYMEENTDSNASAEKSSVSKTKTVEAGSKRLLPWWCIYVAWGVSMTTCVVCSYFVMLYGLKFGYTRSLEWLVAFVTGFFNSTLIQEPVQAIAVAVLLTFVLKKTVRFRDIQPQIVEDQDALLEDVTGSQETKQPYMEPLSTRTLKQIKEKVTHQWKMDITMKNMVIQATYLALFLVIINSHRPVDTAYMSSLTVRNLFINSRSQTHLDQVKTPGDVYRYLHDTLVPSMEEVTQIEDREATLGSNHHLLGSYRLRQLRVKKDTCTCVIKRLIPEGCDVGYEASQQDTGDYGVGWGHNAVASVLGNGSWTFSRASSLNTLSFPGQHATYPGCGYTMNMPANTHQQHAVLSSLEDGGWFDARTRAVFVEFSLYNPSVDLFHLGVILFEHTNLGRVFPLHKIYTTSMFRYLDQSEQVVFSCEILFVLFSIMFAYIQLLKLFKIGRREYFSDFWNIIEVIQVALSFTAVCLSIHRYVTVLNVLTDFKEREVDTFVNLYPLVFSDLVIDYINASLLALLMFKALKLLQFHPRPRIVARTLSNASPHLFHFGFLFFVVILAYSHTTFLFFHKVLSDYREFGHAVLANVGLLLGIGEIADMADKYNILGPLFIIMFMVSVNYCLVTMYAVILNIGRIQTRDSKKKDEDKVHFTDYLINRLKMIFGFN